MKRLDFALQQTFADLNQRTHEADFIDKFPPSGSFQKRSIKNREYWYHYRYDAETGKHATKYVGPDSDPEIRRLVDEFKSIKDITEERADVVRALTSIGFPQPDHITGQVVDALARASLFRLRGVLIGTVAFNCYPGLVGAFPPKAFQTGDVDFAQDHGISISVGESTDNIIEILQAIDPSFRPVPSLRSPTQFYQFMNKRSYKVEFLVPNRGSDDHSDGLTKMPALAGVAAQPLRYLDYLIQEPVRSTMMYAAGIGVTVPSPARFAIHKMIVGVTRPTEEKSSKDLAQSTFLIEALAESAPNRLSRAWYDAWERGPAWREHLTEALPLIGDDARTQLAKSVYRNAALSGVERDAAAQMRDDILSAGEDGDEDEYDSSPSP